MRDYNASDKRIHLEEITYNGQEPNLVAAALEKVSLKSSKDPNALLIA